MPCAVCTMHKDTRSTCFLVEPQNEGQRVSQFGPQNRQLRFGDLRPQNPHDGFLVWASK
jgi:hypothetical protein